jgi:DNA-binding transcriptional MerR regulator
MMCTVKQLAKAAGVTVRTLHYYDEIGLLKPSFVKENGYRYYEEKELLKLQQILFFRELEFPLDDIIRMVNTPEYSMLEALADHKKLLEMKRRRLDRLLHTIDATIKKVKDGEMMSSADLFASFSADHIEQYKGEIKAKWGNTREYQQSVERTKQWATKDFERIIEEGRTITHSLSKLMEKGVASTEVQGQIERHFQHINRFYDCSFEMYRRLGELYSEDQRFAKTYNNIAPHLAEFMRDAIAYYCSQHKK